LTFCIECVTMNFYYIMRSLNERTHFVGGEVSS